MKPKDVGALFLFVVGSELAGGLGSLFTVPSIAGWYQMLQKPALNPPNWIFGPVWTTLFLFMGIAAFLVWKKSRGTGRKIALSLFGVQFVLNVLWSALFFGWHQVDLAFVEIIALWIAILWTGIFFYRHSKPAGILFVPYLAWVSFASYLNFALWSLN